MMKWPVGLGGFLNDGVSSIGQGRVSNSDCVPGLNGDGEMEMEMEGMFHAGFVWSGSESGDESFFMYSTRIGSESLQRVILSLPHSVEAP